MQKCHIKSDVVQQKVILKCCCEFIKMFQVQLEMRREEPLCLTLKPSQMVQERELKAIAARDASRNGGRVSAAAASKNLLNRPSPDGQTDRTTPKEGLSAASQPTECGRGNQRRCP